MPRFHPRSDIGKRHTHQRAFQFLKSSRNGRTRADSNACLPHTSPLATVVLGLAAGTEIEATLPAGEALLKVLSIRNPTQAELDRLLMPMKPPEIEEA